MNNGGSAFPEPSATYSGRDRTTVNYSSPGMSLRDWLAGMYASGLAAFHHTHPDEEAAAKLSYKMADALIKVRDETR